LRGININFQPLTDDAKNLHVMLYVQNIHKARHHTGNVTETAFFFWSQVDFEILGCYTSI